MCSVQKDLFEVFQLLHCKISGIILPAKPSQELLSMVVCLPCMNARFTRLFIYIIILLLRLLQWDLFCCSFELQGIDDVLQQTTGLLTEHLSVKLTS